MWGSTWGASGYSRALLMLSDRVGVGGFQNHHIMTTGMSPKPRSDARPAPDVTTPERERAPSARTQPLARLVFIVSIRMPQRSPPAGEGRVSYCTPRAEGERLASPGPRPASRGA